MANPFKAASQRIRTQPASTPQAVKSMTTAQTIAPWQSGKPQFADWSTDKAVRDGFKVSSYVYTCCRLIARNMASVRWYARDPVTKKEIVNHPFAQIMAKPNLKMDGNDMRERLAYHLLLGGNGLWSKIHSRGTLIEMWPIGPDGISPVPDRAKFISRYEYRRDGVKEDIKPEDIAHFMFIDPANPYWGMSPLQAVARTVDTDVEAIKWNKVAMQNRAVADGAFIFQHSLTDTQYEAAREQVWEQHQGSINARMPWVLGAGASWQQMSLSPVEMDFIESRKMTREEICSVYQVPPPMVGIFDNAALANIETSRVILWMECLIPFLVDWQGSMQLGIAPEFGNDYEAAYDLSTVQALQALFAKKLESAERLFKMGVPVNTINSLLELGLPEDLPGGDVGYLPSTLLPVSIMLNPPEPLALPEPTGEQSARIEHTKSLYWKAFEQRREGYYRLTERKAAEVLAAEGKAVEKAMKAGGLDAAVSAVNSDRSTWQALLKTLYGVIIEDFGSAVFDDATKDATVPFTKDFDVTDVAIQEWIQEWAGERATLITATSIDNVKRVVAKGLAENLSIDKIAKQLREFYDQDLEHRSYRMARTEVIGSSNFGSWQGAKQSGVMQTKSWLSSRDDRTRQDHANADGSSVAIDGKFSVGGEPLEYPGDPKASAKQTIQCRCVLQFTR